MNNLIQWAVLMIGVNLTLITILACFIMKDINTASTKITEMHTLLRYLAARHGENSK